MKQKEATETYRDHSGRLSDVNRQLCFAGIAVVWIFVIKQPSGNIFCEKGLVLPLVCFVSSLALDLLQYIVATLFWGIFQRVKEKSNIKEDTVFYAPRWINWPALAFFWLKVSVAFGGFFLLLINISKRLNFCAL